MKVRKTIKSIFALGAGLTMLGATVFGAMAAADLGAYPSQYINNGKFDGLMVIGSNAKTEDVLGVVDIATSLQFASKVEKPVSGTAGATTTVEGDSYLIASNANQLELGESLKDIKTTIDAQSGLGILETGKVRTSKGSTDVKQYLKLGGSELEAVYETDSEADPNVGGAWVKADSGAELFTYEVQFSDNLESDTDDNWKLEDIEDKDITMLGKIFSIVEGEVTGHNEVKLTLMGGALQDTLKEGESKTYEIGGKKYEVNVLIVADSNDASSAKVKLMINGEVTNSMEDGDTDTLDDGTVIGIRDVLANEGAETNGADQVSFYIGANKIVLDGEGQTLEVDEETIEDTTVTITATTDGGSTNETAISKIDFTTVASDTTYMHPGDKLSKFLDEPQAMVSDQWDILFAGLTQPGSSEISVKSSGNDKYYLDFTSQDGFDYHLLLLDRKTNGDVTVGKENGDALVYQENVTIGKDDEFIVSKKGAEFDANTHVLTLSDINEADNEITLKETAQGNSATYKLKYTDASSASPIPDAAGGRLVANTTTDLTVGGDDYTVYVNETAGWILVDLNADGDVTTGDVATVIAENGVETVLNLAAQTGSGNGNVGNLSFTIDPDAEQEDNNIPSEPINVTIVTDDSKELDANVKVVTNISQDEDSDDTMYMNQYGMTAIDKDSQDGADTVVITVPKEQVFYQVYIVGNDVKTATSMSGKTVAEYQKIEVGAAVLDSEISSVSADNLIVVGGPCANSIAATIMGIGGPGTESCYKDFPVQEGQGIIKMVQNGAKVATVVAGYTAADTRKAAQVLANYESNAAGLKGKSEVVVSGSKITAPEVAADAPAAE